VIKYLDHLFKLYGHVTYLIFYSGEMQGAYQIKVTTSALALILAAKHPELNQIYVQGQLIQASKKHN
jgi:hypothetical protein